MAKDTRTAHMTDAELCCYLETIEEQYGVRVRVALVPLARASGKSSHAVTATAYNQAGKRIHELEATQCYFPGNTSRTFAGAAFYVCTQLVQEVDTWAAREEREREQWEEGRLTPLEQYIAGSY